MYKIAEASTDAAFATIEPTARFSEIGNGGKFAVDGATGVPARVERVAGFLCIIFVLEARIDVADEMVIVIVAHDHFLYLAVLAHLTPKILVEGVKVVL